MQGVQLNIRQSVPGAIYHRVRNPMASTSSNFSISEIRRNLMRAKSVTGLLDHVADGFQTIFPHARVDVEFRSDILDESYAPVNIKHFPILSQNGMTSLLSRIFREPVSAEDVNQKMMGLPLIESGQDLLGLIVLSLKRDEGEFLESAKVLANDLTKDISLILANVVERQRLIDLASTDPLTGIGNRRYFEDKIIHEFNRSKRYGNEFSMLLFDIDHFKACNDKHGHQFGDKVIREVAEVTRQCARTGIDYLARYGGEEFAVILPETSKKGAYSLAERIRRSVEEYKFINDNGERVPVTISIGIATLNRKLPEFDSIEKFIEAADQKLYWAKHNGRNRVGK